MSIAQITRQHIARNPVARAIERARIKRYVADTITEMRTLAHGESCPSMLQGVAEALAIAIKSIEGWDDPQDIGGEMCDAIDRIIPMTGDGHRWDAAACEPMCRALDAAGQILGGMDPRGKLRAWRWAQEVDMAARAAADVAA